MANLRRIQKHKHECTWWKAIHEILSHISLLRNWILQNKMAKKKIFFIHTYTARQLVYEIHFLALLVLILLLFFFSLFQSSFFESGAPEWCWLVISYSSAIMQAKHFSLSRFPFFCWMKSTEHHKKKLYIFTHTHICLAHFDSMWRYGMRKPCKKKITPQKL